MIEPNVIVTANTTAAGNKVLDLHIVGDCSASIELGVEKFIKAWRSGEILASMIDAAARQDLDAIERRPLKGQGQG